MLTMVTRTGEDGSRREQVTLGGKPVFFTFICGHARAHRSPYSQFLYGRKRIGFEARRGDPPHLSYYMGRTGAGHPDKKTQ